MSDSNALKRLEALFDDGSFTEIDAFAKNASGDVEVVAGFGTVNDCAVYAFSQDITVEGGAISVAHCSKLKKIYDLASKTGCPIIGIYDSNGVKLNEGFEVINAYGEVLKASASVSGVCPQISLIAGACLGTSALIANMADVVVAVKEADFYISAPSEITAETSYKDGTVDILCDTFELACEAVKDVISLLPSNNLSPVPIFEFSSPTLLPSADDSAEAIIKALCDDASFVEIKGGYAPNCVTGLATVMGSTVGFIGFDGDSVCPSCAYKAEAMIELCDAYSIPVVTLVNSKGLASGKDTQTLIAVTKLTSAYSTATCPKISILTGEAIGSAYIVLAGKGANADIVYAWDTAVASPLSADSAVAFLFNDRLASGENRDELKKEYIDTIASPFTAAACGAVDDIFVPDVSRTKLIAALDMLAGKRENTLPRKHSVK